MAYNIRFTDDKGKQHFVFYHSIQSYKYKPEIPPDPNSAVEPMGRPARCTVCYKETVMEDGVRLDWVVATLTGPKSNLLKTAIENGVIDLDEGDFAAQSLPVDFLPMTVFHNPCVRMPEVDQIVYGYYPERDGSISVDEVYVDDTGEWTSVSEQDQIATPLLYCDKPAAPLPSFEALRAASELQDQTTM
jgi:hypothetical protein